MKYKITPILNIILIWVLSNNVYANSINNQEDNQLNNEKNSIADQPQNLAKKIMINIEVYPLNSNLSLNDYGHVLKETKPEQTPALLVLSGEPATIEINSPTSAKNVIKINFLANTEATKYDLDFELQQNGQKSISNINQMDIGRSIVFSAKLNNRAKLIKVSTKLVASNNIDTNGINAIEYLSIDKKLKFIYPNQQYIEPQKLWLHDNKLKRAAKNLGKMGIDSSIVLDYSYAYLTNTSKNKIIKGVIKTQNNYNQLRNGGNFANFRGGLTANPVLRIGSMSGKSKDALIEFYILPNKTAFLGRFYGNATIQIINASYLTETEEKRLIIESKNFSTEK